MAANSVLASSSNRPDHEQESATGAEEYAAKIAKIQQACLRPLKEDLADWLNSIMKISYITTDNFMDKLDNGVVICRLAKIISQWCEQQLASSNVPSIITTTNHQRLGPSPTTNLSDLQAHPLSQPSMSGLEHQDQHQESSTPEAYLISSSSKTSSTRNHKPYYGRDAYSNHHQFLPAQQYQTQAAYKLSASTSDVYTPSLEQADAKAEGYEYALDTQSRLRNACITPTRNPHVRPFVPNFNGSLRSSITSQSTKCLSSSNPTNALVTSPAALSSLIEALSNMNHTKIWEDAKCRTFYARDNVSNFIKWSKEFGVNQSVLFESDDLVLHANPRQVILCLLDVARIACVRYGFTEAPGLVKFEQEIGRELAAEQAALEKKNVEAGLPTEQTSPAELICGSDITSSHINVFRPNGPSNGRGLSSIGINGLLNGAVTDATDDLIMRYCRHKEEEAAKKKAATEMEEAEEAARLKADQERFESKEKALVSSTTSDDSSVNCPTFVELPVDSSNMSVCGGAESNEQMNRTDDCDDSLELTLKCEGNLSQTDKPIDDRGKQAEDLLMKSPSSDTTSNKNGRDLMYDTRVDSLDSGEGRTESASTSHSRTPINSFIGGSRKHETSSSIPLPIARSDSSSSLNSSHTSSMGTSELSSSRSSLLSGQDSNSTNTTAAERHVASSDLDGKVMRIAKSYYGMGVTKGVKRLSEGKYKIADRIVFVRLLKGHRVMVRIGGGWDTLENFLFRHKSDPSQVIDVDNLLPIETKMTFDKTPTTTGPQSMVTNGHPGSSNSSPGVNTPLTINGNKFSRLPFYQRSNSASSTNLSASNTSPFPDQSPIDSCTTSTTNIAQLSLSNSRLPVTSLTSPLKQPNGRRHSTAPSPYLLIHRGSNNRQPVGNVTSTEDNPHISGRHVTSSSNVRNRYIRPLGSSRAPTSSSNNLYPATLTTRMTTPTNLRLSKSRLNSTSDLASQTVPNQSGATLKSSAIPNRSEILSKLGRSTDSLQSQQVTSVSRLSHFRGSVQHENTTSRKQPQAANRNRSLVRQSNSINI